MHTNVNMWSGMEVEMTNDDPVKASLISFISTKEKKENSRKASLSLYILHPLGWVKSESCLVFCFVCFC